MVLRKHFIYYCQKSAENVTSVVKKPTKEKVNFYEPIKIELSVARTENGLKKLNETFILKFLVKLSVYY